MEGRNVNMIISKLKYKWNNINKSVLTMKNKFLDTKKVQLEVESKSHNIIKGWENRKTEFCFH